MPPGACPHQGAARGERSEGFLRAEVLRRVLREAPLSAALAGAAVLSEGIHGALGVCDDVVYKMEQGQHQGDGEKEHGQQGNEHGQAEAYQREELPQE